MTKAYDLGREFALTTNYSGITKQARKKSLCGAGYETLTSELAEQWNSGFASGLSEKLEAEREKQEVENAKNAASKKRMEKLTQAVNEDIARDRRQRNAEDRWQAADRLYSQKEDAAPQHILDMLQEMED